MNSLMKYIASECDPDSYADLAFVIALPQWFGEYKREPIYVTKFPGNSYVGLGAKPFSRTKLAHDIGLIRTARNTSGSVAKG